MTNKKKSSLNDNAYNELFMDIEGEASTLIRLQQIAIEQVRSE